MPYTYEYPRAMMTVDVAVVALEVDEPKILLIQRGRQPAQGEWAFPGGFLEMEETLADAARRELKEETGLEVFDVEQVRVMDAVDRDPRGRLLTVLHIAFVDQVSELNASDDAQAVRWYPISAAPELALDHPQMLELVKKRVAERLSARVSRSKGGT